PFYVPSLLETCDSYNLELPDDLEVLYELTTPSGDIVTATQGGNFILAESGAYSLYMQATNPNDTNCPTVRNFDVAIHDLQLSFDYEVIDENCLGDQIWKAVVSNYDVNDVIFRWYNSAGDIVGRSQEFRPTEFGEEYQLSVQPKRMAACYEERLTIAFDQPILRIAGELSYEQECEIFNMSLNLTENADIATWVEWYLFLDDGTVEALESGEDVYSISDERPGVYVVIVYRDKQIDERCEILRESITINPPTF